MNLGLKLEEVREEVLNLLGHGMEGEGSSERGGREGVGVSGGSAEAAKLVAAAARARRRPSIASAAT